MGGTIYSAQGGFSELLFLRLEVVEGGGGGGGGERLCRKRRRRAVAGMGTDALMKEGSGCGWICLPETLVDMRF